MREIIDFHTHPYLDFGQNMCHYKEYYDLTVEGYKQQLLNAGITHICGSVIEGRRRIESFDYIRVLNEKALKLKELLKDFYTPGFHIHPGFVEESCREIEAMSERGVHLIGELVPYMHDWGEFDMDAWHTILDAAGQYGMVCCLHTPSDFDMSEIISSHPGVTFVAAHPGDKKRILEHIEMMRRYDNMFLDLSGTGLFRFGMLKCLVDKVGAERILFGTDYPICNPGMYVQAVCCEEISDFEREQIFFRNAKSILKL